MSDKITYRYRWIIYLLIMGLIFSFIKIGYDLGYEAANPCIEYSTECEIICSGEGTPAYECYEECPCLKRKYD